MSLESIYYIGQTIAVVAILVSLIAIGIQLRQQIGVANAETMREDMSALRQLLGEVSQGDADFRRLMRVATQHYEELSPNQRLQVSLYWIRFFQMVEMLNYSKVQGVGAKDFSDRMVLATLGAIGMPGVRAVWDKVKSVLHPDFTAMIDTRLNNSEDLPPTWNELNDDWKFDESERKYVIKLGRLND